MFPNANLLLQRMELTAFLCWVWPFEGNALLLTGTPGLSDSEAASNESLLPGDYIISCCALRPSWGLIMSHELGRDLESSGQLKSSGFEVRQRNLDSNICIVTVHLLQDTLFPLAWLPHV